MEFKIPYKTSKNLKNQRGFTLFELVLVVTITILLSGWVIVKLNPGKSNKRARDNKRLSSLSKLEIIITSYQLDNSAYPGNENYLYESNIIPPACSELSNSSCGWIETDVSAYSENLPVDPLNDNTYHFSYYTDGSSYELNAYLEYLTEEMQNDGGNDPNMYEVGNNLTLISP